MIVFPNGVKPAPGSAGRAGRPAEPETFKAYRSAGGYEALEAALGRPPSAIIDEVSAAGLRGKGGAGFPAAKKWQIAADTEAYPRYVVCNAGEDEPGSFKDRAVIEHRPHLVLEGMILAAYAVGAEEAFLYLNETYDTCHDRMSGAISEARGASYLGEEICGTPFSLEVSICRAPTTYVAGEDSASLEFLEGREAKPREKPPYPAVAGLYGKPTIVNNVETLAHVVPILRHSAAWYRGFGVEDSPGTMIFCLGEEVNEPGAYELPVGTTARYLLEECGGGLRDGASVRAFLPGGPSCAFLTGDDLDVRLEPEALKSAGSSLGCGVMRYYPKGTCMLEPTLELAEFFAKECCQQCPACRMETSMLTAVLDRIRQGQGDQNLYEQFPKIIDFNRGKGYCALINMPGPPLLSALRLFGEDFDHHLEHGSCRQPSAAAEDDTVA